MSCSTWRALGKAFVLAALLQNARMPASTMPVSTKTGTWYLETGTWFDLPLAGGARTLAFLGIDPQDRAHTIPLVARILYGNESRAVTTLPRLTSFLRAAPPSSIDADGEAAAAIPVPLSRDAWRALLAVDRDDDLATRLLTDRAATFLAAGLIATHPTIRNLALEKPDFLRRLYTDSPGAFVTAARSLRIENGAVTVPGGDQARNAWEQLAGASTARPDTFITALAAKDGGRLAWFFDTMANWKGAVAADSLRGIYEGFRGSEPRWRLEDHPFRRTAADPSLLLHVLAFDGTTIAGPAWQWFWEALFARGAIDRAEAPTLNPGPAMPVTVSWLVTSVAASVPRERRERFEAFRLAQRMFPEAGVEDAADLLVALSAYRSHKAVLLALERMGITAPSTWAAVVEAARQVDAAGNRREALMSFQGAIALVARAHRVGSIDSDGADRLLRDLSGRVRAERRVPGAVREWLAMVWCCRSGIIDALAGPAPRAKRVVEWEGLSYELDFAAAERERLINMLRVLGAADLDTTLRTGDDAAIANALLTLTYAAALGDPAGAITLSPDLPRRHNFGLSGTALSQETLPWSLAAEQQGIGRTWHVEGSLIGLDLALARLSMKHIADDAMPAAPTLSLNDFDTFARTAVALVPDRLRDEDRDALVAAIARGRARVAAAGRDVSALQSLANEINWPAASTQLLPWIVTHEPHGVLFSMRDLMWLGFPEVPPARLHHWGMFAQALDARLTLLMPSARAWEDFAGRSDTGQLSTQVPDLTLRLAEETARLGVPAALVPGMLASAVQDYWYGVQARFSDDFVSMTRAAARLRPERAEDYVAALAGTGPLRLVRR
jgi:hypothetical protein